MDAKSQAELDILIAADRWARDVMRQEKHLDPIEQNLLETIMYYQRLTRSIIEIPPPDIPSPPALPKTELESYIEHDTARYSDIPTKPSPAGGTLVVKEDIEPLELEDLEEWTGKQKPE